MVQKTFSCFISLMLWFLAGGLPLLAQTPQTSPPAPAREKSEKPDQPQYPLYNGLSVGLDLWGIGSKIIGGDNLSLEIAVDANLKNRFFPTVELGYGRSDADGDLGISYKTSAPYFRIGIDYNAFYKKEHGNMLMVGLRYAATSFKYDIEALGIDDPVYGGTVGNPNLEDDVWGGSLPYHYTGMKGSMQWVEICLGIRAKVWQSLYMGWAVRLKYKLNDSIARYGNPWYVPGFGEYGSNTIGVTYTITYKLPF